MVNGASRKIVADVKADKSDDKISDVVERLKAQREALAPKNKFELPAAASCMQHRYTYIDIHVYV